MTTRVARRVTQVPAAHTPAAPAPREAGAKAHPVRPDTKGERRQTPAAVVAGKPRDGVRFGLPVGVLVVPGSEGGGPSGVLLVAAALLLGAAAGGSTVLGVAARSATRQT